MSEQNGNSVRIPKPGDRVRTRRSIDMKGRIVELRGALAPGGIEIYRVKLANQPKPAYIEVSAEQLEFLDDENGPPAS